MAAAISLKGKRVFSVIKTALAALCLFTLLAPHQAHAQFSPEATYDYARAQGDMGDYLNPDITLQTLLAAIDPDSPDHDDAIGRFNQIARQVQPTDPDTGELLVKPCGIPTCTEPVSNRGGQFMVNQIINAIEAGLGIPKTAPATWYANPGPQTAADPTPGAPDPTGVAPVVAFLGTVLGSENGGAPDLAAFRKLQKIFVDNDFFGDLGYKPAVPVACAGQGCVDYYFTGQNIGYEALGYMAGGGGLDPFYSLNTLADALDGTPDAKAVMSVILTRFSLCNNRPPPNTPDPDCNGDKSEEVYATLKQSLGFAGSIDKGLEGKSLGDVVRAALGGNIAAGSLLSQVMAKYLETTSKPAPAYPACLANPPPQECSSFIGYAGVAYLQGMVVDFPPPAPKAPAVTPDAPVSDTIKTSPVFGGGLHDIPSTGDNTAPAPCEWEASDVTLQYHEGNDDTDAKFGTDPCVFTRDKLELDFAQKFKGGDQWAGYFPTWVQEQWIPALKAMTAQWTAAIIDQTRMIGSLMDAINASHTAAMIQKHEVDDKLAVMPSEQACVSASPAQGLAHAESLSNNMSHALRAQISTFAGTGGLPP